MTIKSFKYLLVLCCLILPSTKAFSQDGSVGAYVPPPLFGNVPSTRSSVSKIEKKAEPKKHYRPAEIIQLHQNDNNAAIKPKVSKSLREEKAIKAAKIKKNNSIPIPKVKPNRTSTKPVVKIKISEKTVVPVVTAPPSQGVVKGPKTMPAVKKKDVDTEVLNEGQIQNKQTDMLARIQKEEPPKEINPVDKPEQSKAVASNASLLKDRLVLIFDLGETALSGQKQEILTNQVIPALNGKRLNVTAFASPQADSLNADKRLALSRGLAVRSFLIENGLNSSQINIRSLGAQTTQQPYDRVELELVE